MVEGYEVMTSDDCKLGSVVAVEGGNVIVEHGTLRKARHAVPMAFAETDDSAKVVRLSVSKEIVESSPKLNGSIDEQAIAAHYGLAEAFDAPETEGYGDVLPDDPAFGAEQDATRAGVETGPQQSMRTRDEMAHPERELGSSPGLLGDRIENG